MLPSSPTFHHDNDAVNNFINLLLTNTTIHNRAQLILMSGIALNDVELVKYAAEIDHTVINTPVPNSVVQQLDSILFPAIGIRMGTPQESPS